jgi:hypothetical protein
MAVRPDFYRRYRDVSNIAFSPFDLNQAFRYDARLARERREVVAALAGALLVDTQAELRVAWRAIIRRGPTAVDRAELGRMPMTDAAARDLANGPWRDAALRNRMKLEWQSWAQQKYRRLARRPSPASQAQPKTGGAASPDAPSGESSIWTAGADAS